MVRRFFTAYSPVSNSEVGYDGKLRTCCGSWWFGMTELKMRKLCWLVLLAPFVAGDGAAACQTSLNGSVLSAAFDTECSHEQMGQKPAAMVLAQVSDGAGDGGTATPRTKTAQSEPGVSEVENNGSGTQEAVPAGEETAVADETAVELVFWQSIRDSTDFREYEEYLKQFPNGRFAGLAKVKIKRLKEDAAAKSGQQPAETELAKPEKIEPAPDETIKEEEVTELPAEPETVNEEKTKEVPGASETAEQEPTESAPEQQQAIEDEGGEEDSGHAVTDQAEVPPSPDQQETADDNSKQATTASDEEEDADQSAALPTVEDDPDETAADPRRASPPVQLCDRIAGHPEDELRKAKGVHLELMAAERGRKACRQALRAYPDEPRFIYQMGRSHAASGNFDEAKEWIKRAADLGYPMAATHMGELHYEGQGYRKNPRLAARWFLKATKLGNARAHLLFGDLLELGEGVKRNPIRAAKYVFEAVKRRNRSSIFQMNRNADEWSPEFRREFQELMQEAGVYDGEIDGQFGPQTRQAVIRLARGQGG